MKQNLRNVSGVFEFAYFVHLAQKWLFDDNIPFFLQRGINLYFKICCCGQKELETLIIPCFLCNDRIQ